MARWTKTPNDIKKISYISKELPIGGIVRIILDNNQVIEGVMRRSNSTNNAGEGGWQYNGEVEIETTNHQRHVIDYLDIQSVTDIWSTHSEEYERLGLIKIV